MSRRPVYLIPLVLLSAITCTTPPSSAPATQTEDSADLLVLRGILVVDPVRGVIGRPQNIVISNGKVRDIAFITELPHSSTEIDCTGKYAVPGLFDCHTHLAHLATEGEAEARTKLGEFVRRGVTQVRDVGGPIDVLSRLHERITRGETVGPELFFTGPMLERSPLTYEAINERLPGFTVAIDSREDADRLPPELAQRGASMIKIFNRIDRDVFEHLIRVARRNSMQIVFDPGMPLFHDVPIDQALNLGVTSIEHAKAPWPVVLIDELKEEHDRLAAGDGNEMARMMFMMRVAGLGAKSVSMERLHAIADLMIAKDAYLCPTLNVLASLEAMAVAQIKQQQQIEEIPEFMMQAIRKNAAGMETVSQLVVREFAARGVKMLVGQDGIEPEGVFVEMRWMKECGVSDLEILRGATIYPARWLGVDERLGTITPGRDANILIVNRNPLEDVANLEDTFLVLRKGAIVTRE